MTDLGFFCVISGLFVLFLFLAYQNSIHLEISLQLLLGAIYLAGLRACSYLIFGIYAGIKKKAKHLLGNLLLMAVWSGIAIGYYYAFLVVLGFLGTPTPN